MCVLPWPTGNVRFNCLFGRLCVQDCEIIFLEVFVCNGMAIYVCLKHVIFLSVCVYLSFARWARMCKYLFLAWTTIVCIFMSIDFSVCNFMCSDFLRESPGENLPESLLDSFWDIIFSIFYISGVPNWN